MPKRSYHDPIDCAQHLTPLKGNNKKQQQEQWSWTGSIRWAAAGSEVSILHKLSNIEGDFYETFVNAHQLTAGAAEAQME